MAVSEEFERFIADNFDSEEAVIVTLALRESRSALTAGEVLTRVELSAGQASEDRRLAEKRIELRLRDLVERGLIAAEGNTYRYADDEAGRKAMMDRLMDAFTNRRGELNRIIYSSSARARRLAEAFRF